MTVIVSCDDFVQKLWVNDIPLHAFGRVEQYWEGVLGAPELYGDPLHVPLRPGAIDIPQVPGKRPVLVGVLTYGQSQAEHNDSWRDLARLLWSPEQALNLKRTMRFTAGDETHECRAKYVSGLDASMLAGGRMGRMAIRFDNLDGYWYQTDTTDVDILGGSDTVAVGGDAVTRQMTVQLSGGTNQVLTNTTTGTVLSFLGDTTTPVSLDVPSFTATQGGSNVVTKVNHANDTFWMTLAPGDNEFTLTGGGSATISAKAAYL